MIRSHILILNIFLAYILFSCDISSDQNNKDIDCVEDVIQIENKGLTQGTTYNIKYLGVNNFQKKIDSLLLEIDNCFSLWNDSSIISRINRGEVVILNSMFIDVFFASQEVYHQTDGMFDCTIGPLVKAWGFGSYDSKSSSYLDSNIVSSLLMDIGFSKLELNKQSLIMPENMMVDFNAIAQGYSVDVIANFLISENINNFFIEIGGEIRCSGYREDNTSWTVGIDKPLTEIDYDDRFALITPLINKSLATSGNYRNFYIQDGVKYSHTINPITGYPEMNSLLSVSVLHNSCMYADAYATAFMVMGLEKTKLFLKDHPELEVYLIYVDGDSNWQTYFSDGFLQI